MIDRPGDIKIERRKQVYARKEIFKLIILLFFFKKKKAY